jgi:uncharacterized protein YndB with AHSA1/START domain/DNA-binding transcriptional ArsR family regulator
MGDVYDAVADPTRRRLLDFLAESGEQPLHALVDRFPMGRTAVSKHLAILREAGLVRDRRVGRERRYELNAGPLREIQGWISFYEQFWSERVGRLRGLLEEEPPVTETVALDFELRSPIERVWQALTDPAMLSKWMFFETTDFRPVAGHRFQFRGKPGSGGWVVDCEVLEVDAPRRLSYTWEVAAAGHRTRVTWTLTAGEGGVTGLHLEQSGFGSDRKQEIGGAKYGWTAQVDQLQALLASG